MPDVVGGWAKIQPPFFNQNSCGEKMNKKWFKMPTGAGQSADLAIIANKIHVPKIAVICCFLIFCDLKSENKNKEEIIELSSFMTEIPEAEITATYEAIEKRGLFPEFSENSAMSDAERQRRARERKKSVTETSRDSHEAVTNASRDSHALERPDQRDQKERPDQKERVTLEGVTGAQGQVGSFLKGLGVGVGSGRRFDIEPLLETDDFIEINHLAPTWDRKALFAKYNSFVANDPPRKPREAFIGWLKKFTQGQGKNP